MPDYKKSFTDFIQETNVAGSGKATSYIRAIDLLCELIIRKPFSFSDCKNLWAIDSLERLQELYLFVLAEKNKRSKSEWNFDDIPPSYLRDGYCSAALKSYQEFLVEHSYEGKVLTAFDEYEGDESKIVEKLDTDIEYPEFLIAGLDKRQGEEVIRSVRVRSNQNVFRKMILKIYKTSCCITGLDLPEVLRASHIMPWSENPDKRLDPRNGLCLSATYDAAFDRNLISLDDDFRIIISKEISDYYTSESVKEYFLSKEGNKIKLPSSYLPQQGYLSEHRSRGRF